MSEPTGLGFGEAAASRVSDVDVPARRIRVRRSVTYVRKTGLVEGPTKNHTARAVPVPAFLARLLETEIADRDYLCRTGQRWATASMSSTAPLLRRLLARWGGLLSKHNVPIPSHAHDRKAETRTNIGDRFSLGEGPSRAYVLKFALRVVVIDQQHKARAFGSQRPLEHLAVSARVTCGQDRPAAALGLAIRHL